MLLAILRICSEEELAEDDDDTRTIPEVTTSPADVARRRQQIKTKILAVGKMQRVFQLLRQVSLGPLLTIPLIPVIQRRGRECY
jgi:serine/threonine-protein phosphatase 2B catalytic subunit